MTTKSSIRRGGSGSSDLLSLRALNRATLEQQMLLRRRKVREVSIGAEMVSLQGVARNH